MFKTLLLSLALVLAAATPVLAQQRFLIEREIPGASSTMVTSAFLPTSVGAARSPRWNGVSCPSGRCIC